MCIQRFGITRGRLGARLDRDTTSVYVELVANSLIVPFEFPGSLSGRQEEKDLLVLFCKEKREMTDHNTRLPVARSVHALAPLAMRRVCHVTRSETATRAGRKRDMYPASRTAGQQCGWQLPERNRIRTKRMVMTIMLRSCRYP